ncbi:hypothetical protein O7627_35205 [Solwaraspora sp. WMMD1047]|uniref:hypothetical protein n=1 Tax=Solwaraspora sp. WMMD1047 TaxID=3016102 RepID=UPI0024165A12|nr:hypothetical protein [Solwaraspora sp. WMMD1047]MDG4834519.1 hypothetical protein [Solwaraspora sp. WMMD1047]
MFRIALHVGNIDLRDPVVVERIANIDSLCEISWESIDGRVRAVIYCDEHDPIGQIIQIARRITHTIPEAKINGLDQDLVSISDIATRVGLTREAVRLWTKGQRGPGGFPAALGSIGGGDRGSTQVWSWPDVNAWLERHFGLGDGDEYLSPEQVAKAQAALLQIEDYLDHDWRELVQLDIPASLGVISDDTAEDADPLVAAPSSDPFIPVVSLNLGVKVD